MSETRAILRRQFDVAWGLCAYHLDGLTTEECLWRPADAGLHVRRDAEGEKARDQSDQTVRPVFVDGAQGSEDPAGQQG